MRRARFAITSIVAALLIGAAAAVGLMQLLLPLATQFPDVIAAQLSDRLHRPVKFAAISSEWQPSGPVLKVRGLTLGPAEDGDQSITFPHAALKFDFGAWLRPAHRWITLRLNDMNLKVEHSASGWQVLGFGTSDSRPHSTLQSLPVDLDLRNLHVDIIDDVGGRSWRLFAPRLRVVNVGDSIRFGGSVRQTGTGQAATLVGRMVPSTHDYSLYLSSRELDLAEAARGVDLHGYSVHTGRADIELWGSWHDNRLVATNARYQLKGVTATGPDGRKLDIPRWGGALHVERADSGWDIAWRGPGKPDAGIDDAGGVLAHVRGHPGAWRVTAAATAVDLSPWLEVLAMAPAIPDPLAQWVANAQPRLRIDSAALAWNQGGKYDATLRFSGLGATPTGVIPGLQLAHGTLRADQQTVSLQLPPQVAVLAITHEFRQPFRFAQLGGTLVAWRDRGLWNVAAHKLHFDMGSVVGNGRAHLVWLGQGQRPFLSASVAVAQAKVTDAPRFWPYRGMHPKVMAWLDHALVAGEVTRGRVLVRGRLDDWPFLDNEGRFEATGVVQDATFDFDPDWPRATGVDAAVDFVDNHMGIVATHLEVGGVTATHAVAEIPDLAHGVLNLKARGGASGGELLGFVRDSPVGAGAIDALRGLSIGGTGKFRIDLTIPFHDAQEFTLDGRVDLARADVTADKWNLALQDVTGPVLINGKGFSAANLSAVFRGAAAKLSMAEGTAVGDPANLLEASLDTSVSAQTLVQGYPDMAGLVAHASGVAPFHIGVKLVAGTAGAPATPVLNVQSSLAGIALDFPAPLHKPAATTLPLELSLRLPPAGAPLTVSLGNVLQVRGRLADPEHGLATALAVNFGGEVPVSVPTGGLVVGGHASTLDVSGWIQQALAGGSGSSFPRLLRAQVGTGDAVVFGTHLGELTFDFKAGQHSDTISLDGKAVKGTVQLATTDFATHGITADLQRLYWPQPPPDPAAAMTPPAPDSPLAPAAIPPLHVTIGDLRLGNAHLGQTSFESAPTIDGMRVARFDSKGDDFTVHSQGTWTGTRESSRSRFVVDINSQDFGKMLDAFGFGGLLAGGHDSHVRLEGTWPGAPSSFSLAWMTGSLQLKVGDGSILAVKPGLGRVLGLLSVRELPSRLTLHFGDVFKSGFGFDEASATFALRDGGAYTHDMLIDAPAAKIAMQGRVGFRKRDYDLTVHVTPHVGVALPVVGAVIGGPVGAAAGLVAQGLFGKGLNHAAGSVYSVTGSWDKPLIRNVSSAPVPATTAAASANAGMPLPAGTAVLAASPGSAIAPVSAASLPTPAPATALSVARGAVMVPVPASTAPAPPAASARGMPAPASSAGSAR